MLGKNVSHYEILEHLGEGGMGVVYKARDTKLDRDVALKFLPTKYLQDKEKEVRFIHEAKTASGLDHPNICTIYEINNSDDGELYIAMGYYSGKTLKQRIKEGPLDLEESIEIAIQIASGLSKAHKNGIVHRDIKPANIIFTEEGTVKVLDFGLAKMAGVRMTTDGSTLGTVAYMSPEQATGGEVDEKTDIWALGIMFFEMLTGGLPFAGNYPQALIYSIINSAPENIKDFLPEAPNNLEHIFQKLFEKDSDKRYTSIDDFVNDLKLMTSFSGDLSTTIVSKANWQNSFVKQHDSRVRHSTTIILTPRKKQVVVLSLVVTVLVLIFGTFFISQLIYNKSNEELLSSKPTLAVMSFENRTNRDGLDKIVIDMFITNLSRIDKIEVVSQQRLFDVMKKKSSQAVLDKSKLKAIAKNAGFNILMTGSITELGSKFRLNVQLINVNTGRNIVSDYTDGQQIDDLFGMIDNLTQKITSQVGFDDDNPNAEKLADITTKSIEAYEYYVQGLEDFYLRNYYEAVDNVERAIKIDSVFATAYLLLSQTYDMIGNVAGRDNAIIKAKEYSKNSTPKEKLYINAAYADAIEKNLMKRIEILEKIATEYPDEKQVHYLLGTIYFELGDERAFSEQEKALELDSEFGPALNALVYFYLKPEISDFEKALHYLRRYLKIYPDEADPHDTMGDIYFTMGRIEDAIEKYKEASKLEPGFSEFRIAYMYAILEEYNMAFYWIQRSIDMAPSEGIRAESYQMKGFLHYWLGEYDDAIEDMDKAVTIFKVLNNSYSIAVTDFYLYMIYSEKGNKQTADIHLNAMEKYFNSNSELDKTLYFMFKILLDKNNLDITSTIEDSDQSTETISRLVTSKKWAKFYYNYIFSFKMLQMGFEETIIKFVENNSRLKIRVPSQVETYIIYNLTRKNLTAIAYEKSGNHEDAISEYLKILQPNPERNDMRLIHPKYHYELGEIYETTGNIEKALAEYKQFLYLWNHADPSLDEIKKIQQRIDNISNN